MRIVEVGRDATARRESRMRSILFVPGDSERKIEKAVASKADAIVIDLEDSVSPSEKAEARHLTKSVLLNSGRRVVGVRVNARDTEWHLHDLAVIAGGGPDFIMLPKCTSSEDLMILDHQLAVLETAYGLEVGHIGLIPLVTETAASVQSLDYRSAPARLMALGFAGEDFSADLGVAARGPTRNLNPLLVIGRQMTAIAAAAARVPAIDTPFPDPKDAGGLESETVEARELGFGGKLCIHPSQIDIVHSVMKPSEDELRWAKAVADAFETSPNQGVTLLDGKMIDRAHLRLALRRLAMVPNDETTGV